MALQSIVQRYRERFVAQFGERLSADQWSALNAIGACRQGPYGELMLSCQHCHHHSDVMRSCGHRPCNQCQYHSVEAWLERQRQKQLPVNYYLVTFTLPAALRCLARAYPKAVYALLMQCAAETLKTFGLNKKGLEAQLGLCAVLHTHNRRLDFHPHVHVVVPGGGIHPARREWRKLKGKYLFNGKALASVFRGIFLRALEEAGLTPGITPKRWIAHCKGVGRGEQALAYLARYLYRGVISNRHIIEDDDNYVTFRYRNSVTGKWETRRETGEVFIYLLMTAIMSPFVDAACITKGLSACQGLWLFARQRQGVIKNRTVGISCATTRTVKEDSQHLCMSLLWCRHGSQWHQTGTGEAGLSV